MLRRGSHEVLTDAIGERACLYALGTLDAQETREFEQHLIEGCLVCAQEVRAFQETAAMLPAGRNTIGAPGSVKDRLLERIAPPPPGVHVSRAGEAPWEEAAPGVFVRKLAADRPDGQSAVLVRMQPGSHYPEHDHPRVEHCYVIEGSIRFGKDFLMRAGDYQVAAQFSNHDASWSESGCVLLVMESGPAQ